MISVEADNDKSHTLAGIRELYSTQELMALAADYDRIVIWGRNFWHTHYWITVAYYQCARRVGLNVLWLEDKKANWELVGANDLLIFNLGDQEHLPDTSYRSFIAFSRPNFSDDNLRALSVRQGLFIHQQSPVRPIGQRIDNCTWYDGEGRLLQQPWGTDRLPEEFGPPVIGRSSNSVFWIGSIWGQKNLETGQLDWGNKPEMAKLREALSTAKVNLIQIEDAYNSVNYAFTRLSRVAPVIQGIGQVSARHLTCRFFKNISYGQFAISNNAESAELLGASVVYDEDIPSLIDSALSVSPKDAVEFVMTQQEQVSKYTIFSHLYVALSVLRQQ